MTRTCSPASSTVLQPPRVLVGLRNPWPVPRRSRHNMGALVLEALAANFEDEVEWRWCWSCMCWIAAPREGCDRPVLVQTYAPYNWSGFSVRRVLELLDTQAEDMVLLHDDLDVAPGRSVSKASGSAGGNRGVKSVLESLGTDRVRRLRLGIGRPAEAEAASSGGSRSRRAVIAHVLSEVDADTLASFQASVAAGEVHKLLGLEGTVQPGTSGKAST